MLGILLIYLIFSIAQALPGCSNLTAVHAALEEYVTGEIAYIANISPLPDTALIQIFTSLMDVDEKHNLIKIRMAQALHFDGDFEWEPENYCGINIYSSVKRPENWEMTMGSNRVRQIVEEKSKDIKVNYEGDTYVPINDYATVDLSCSMDPTYWPFHDQVCKWTAFTTLRAGLKIPIKEVACHLLQFEQVNPLWEFRGCTGIQKHGPFIMNIISVEWKYLFSPTPDLALMSLIIPLMLLATIGPTLFLLPADAENRTDLAVALLLANFLTMETLNGKVPQSRNIPHFYICTLCCVSINVTEIGAAIFLVRHKASALVALYNQICGTVFAGLQVIVWLTYVGLLLQAERPICGTKVSTPIITGESCTFLNDTFYMQYVNFPGD